MSDRVRRLLLLLVFSSFICVFIGCQNDDDDDDDSVDDDTDDDTGDDDTTDDDTDDDSADDDFTDDDTADDDSYDFGDLIENPGFETGLIDPWTGEWTGDLLCDSSICDPRSGDYSAWLGNCANCTETLMQVLSLPADEYIEDLQIYYWLKPSKQESPSGSFRVDLFDETGVTLIANLEQIDVEDFTETGEWWVHDGVLSVDDFVSHLGENLLFSFELEVQGDETAIASVMIDEVHFLWFGH